ncbi:Spy/CpxP family protein refolding chaperone [Halomonas sp. E14]|uniref:Spy/CpxP family protein refolding chaperone n=1 Tax=Halomonas sp. E14 TaxID=3397245 RepID=UPI00403E4CAE
MTVMKFLIAALASLGIVTGAVAQQMQAPPQGDQVGQLAELLDLDENQQQEIRELMGDAEARIAPLEQEAQALQVRLGSHVEPNYDEAAIRDDASRLGALTGEITAETVLLQAKVEAVFTEEQRQQLDAQIAEQQRQMQQMQDQMQQQQGGGQPIQ